MDDNLAVAGAGRAALIAGPCFVLSTSAAVLYGRIPEPIIITPGEFFGLLFLMIPASLVGFILGFLPSLLGSVIMGWLARHIPALRLAPIWTLVGGALAGIPYFMEPEDASFGFAFVVTGAICATICRRHWRWD